MPHISGDQILSYRIPLPDLEHQRAIVYSLSELQTAGNQTARSITNQLDRLQEYRQALITAAVTGQLDIGAAA